MASNENSLLMKGGGCAGDATADPVGATFDQVYNANFFHVVWNDQFYDDPEVAGCTQSCGAPWGHSKDLLAWNGDGDAFVLQVTTPSWPAAGSEAHYQQVLLDERGKKSFLVQRIPKWKTFSSFLAR
jgi:Deoxyribonuclease II